jgi:hypothetical protein
VATPTTTRWQRVRARLQAWIPQRYREAGYRVVAGLGTFLLAFGVLSSQEAALWTNLGVSTVTSLFAMLYATTAPRLALYALVGPVGGVLQSYGLVSDSKWLIIVTAAGQLFGITTAAAKTVQAPVVRAGAADEFLSG